MGLLRGESTLQQGLAASQQLPSPNDGVCGLTPTFYSSLHYSKWWVARNCYRSSLSPRHSSEFQQVTGLWLTCCSLRITFPLSKSICICWWLWGFTQWVLSAMTLRGHVTESGQKGFMSWGLHWSAQRGDFIIQADKFSKKSVWGAFVVCFLTLLLIIGSK